MSNTYSKLLTWIICGGNFEAISDFFCDSQNMCIGHWFGHRKGLWFGQRLGHWFGNRLALQMWAWNFVHRYVHNGYGEFVMKWISTMIIFV